MAFEQVMLRTADGQEYGPATMEMVAQWRREGRVPPEAVLADVVTGETRPLADFPLLVIPPPPMPGGPAVAGAPAAAPSGMDHLIPTKNPNALVAYYCGVFGIIPCFSPILGPLALILGFLGVRDHRRLNVGKAHAIAGIVLGALETLATIAAVVILVINAAWNR